MHEDGSSHAYLHTGGGQHVVRDRERARVCVYSGVLRRGGGIAGRRLQPRIPAEGGGAEGGGLSAMGAVTHRSFLFFLIQNTNVPVYMRHDLGVAALGPGYQPEVCCCTALTPTPLAPLNSTPLLNPSLVNPAPLPLPPSHHQPPNTHDILLPLLVADPFGSPGCTSCVNTLTSACVPPPPLQLRQPAPLQPALPHT
jgi:hypothetical protein